MKIRPYLFALLLVAFVTTGCIFSPDDDDSDGGGNTPSVIEPTTPDKLMQNFEKYYAERNLDAYREMLSEDYKWIPQEGEIWNYDLEIDVANKMFNEIPGEGGLIVSNISIDQLDPQGVWTATDENDPNFGSFPGSQYRTYIVDIKFSFSGQDFLYRVQGPVKYFVTSYQPEPGKTYWQILGMEDATFGN